MKRLIVFMALATLLATGVAHAKVGPPVTARLAERFEPAQADAWWTNTIQLNVGEVGTIENLELTGPGWEFDFISPGPYLAYPEEPVEIVIRAWNAMPDKPIAMRFTFEGQEIHEEFTIGPETERKWVRPQVGVEYPEFIPGFDGSGMKRPGPGEPSDEPAARDAHPSLQTVFDESHDMPRAGEKSAATARDITVRGHIVYLRDGVSAGVDGALVKIYDEDRFFDQKLGETTTAPDGSYSVTFNWDPCGTCESQPDIYVEVEAKNDWVVVERGFLETNYRFATGTLEDYEGTDLHFNPFGDSDEDRMPAWHLLTNVTRLHRWIEDNTGLNTRKADARWPISGDGAHYNNKQINISHEREWWDQTHAHEYGHHFMDQFAPNESPDYCNGYCDDSPSDCSHCSWCEETDHDAFNEGWPSWLADTWTRRHKVLYGVPALEFRDREVIGECTESGVPCDCDPLKTEGFLSALLRDIEDPVNERDPATPEGDELTLGVDEIFTVTTEDQPTTPLGFLAAFMNRYPQHVPALWATAKHNGYEIDNANPFAVDDLVCTDHVVGVPSPDATLRLTWSKPFDEVSGVVGYSVLFSENPATEPDIFDDVGDVTAYNSPILPPGTYYASIRAVDRSGKAGAATQIGPFIVRAADPANLTFEQNPGWYDEVVPRSLNDTHATYLPAPVNLTGNAATTYWSFRTINTGEQATQAGLIGYAMTDGVWNFNFNSDIGYSYIPAVQGGGFDNSLNQGPLEVRGGRHTFGVQVDYFEDEAETDEHDNYWARQWVWSPLVMPIMNASYDRSNGPPSLTGGHDGAQAPLYFNSDGFRFTGTANSWYAASLVMDDLDSDYDIRLHAEATGPTDPAGFGPTLGYSTRGPGYLDAVFVNGHNAGAQTWDVGVVQGNSTPDLGGFEVTLLESSEILLNVEEPVSWAWGEQILLREFYIGPILFGTGRVTVVVRTDPADGPLYVHHLDETFTTGDINDFTTWGVTDPVDGILRMDLDLTHDSWHGLVVYRDPREHRGAMDFTVALETYKPDLKPTTLAGWHGPLVPHTYQSGPDGSTPDRLSSAQDSTWISLAFENDASVGVSGSFGLQVAVDGVDETVLYYTNVGSNAAKTTHYVFPFTVPAGRHTLGMDIDTFDTHPEVYETNNTYAEQWIWEPPTMQMGHGQLSLAPPDKTGGFDFVQSFENLYFNAQGYRTPVFTPSGTDERWGVVFALPELDVDVDLRLHEVSTGPKDGFGPSLAMSGWGPGHTDFVLINFHETPLRQFDVGVVNGYGSDPGTGIYIALATHSTWLGTEPTGTWGPYPMYEEPIALHEVEWSPGTKAVRLVANDAVADLGISVYPGDQPFMGKSDVLDVALDYFDPAGSDEMVSFNVPETDTYVIAVWMVDGSSVDDPVSYSLDFDEVSDVPEAGPVNATRLASVQPNPFNPQTTIHFELHRAGEARVEIFDVRGKRVRSLLTEDLPAGRHDVVWNGLDDHGHQTASGTYLVRLRANGGHDVRRIMLLK